MEGFDLFPALVGGVVGALAGAAYEWWSWRRRRRPAEPSPDAGAALDPAERRRAVEPVMERASRAMAAYSHMIDAGNLEDLDGLRRLFERLRADELADAVDARPGDRRLVAALDAFASLHDEIDRKVEQRIASGQPAAAAGEIRLRGPALASAIDELNAAAERYLTG